MKVPLVLSRFRAVVTQNPKKDSAAHKPLRKLFEDSPKEFLAQWNRLEDEHKGKVAARERSREVPADDGAVPEVDPGLEAVDELITKLLAEWALPNVGGSGDHR